MKSLKILFFIFIVQLFFFTKLSADVPHFVDFKFILNESVAGKKAQDFLKKKLNDGIKNIKSTEKKIQEEHFVSIFDGKVCMFTGSSFFFWEN